MGEKTCTRPDPPNNGARCAQTCRAVIASGSHPSCNFYLGHEGWPSTDPRSEHYCYQPCRYGVHVCGQHPDGENFLTVANFSARGPHEARRMFALVKAECVADPAADPDFIVDLMINGDIDQDFPMHRQMLDRLRAALGAPEHG